MKKVYHILLAVFVAGAFLTSCEEIETGFAKLTSEPDPAAGYYLQFINAAQSFETGVTEAGGLVEIVKPIAVVIMGMPQSQAITVDLAVDPSSTIASNMYSLSASSITIPAGSTSGSITLTTTAANMPVGETLKLVLNLDAGEHNSPNSNGTKLTYELKRIEFCPLVNGIADLVGSWSGEDAYYDSEISTAVDGTQLRVSGMNAGFISDWWAETIVAGGSFLMTVTGNGLVDIPRQYIFTTVYSGTQYRYEIKGSGKWENCGASPRFIITYDIYYEGDADGLAKMYASYLGGIPYLTADITLDITKGAANIVSVHNNIIKPDFKR